MPPPRWISNMRLGWVQTFWMVENDWYTGVMGLAEMSGPIAGISKKRAHRGKRPAQIGNGQLSSVRQNTRLVGIASGPERRARRQT